MMRIANKRQMYDLLRRGKLGNTTRVFGSVQQWLKGDYRGQVTIRSTNVGDALKAYNLSTAEALALLRKHNAMERPDLIVAEGPPTDELTLQAYVGYTTRGLECTYTFVKEAARTALEKQTLHAVGARAALLLREYVDPSSLDDIYELLSMYPGHMVEFSCFRVPVGENATRKAIIWEVRDY